ncbi:hypothetical protein PFISCL1PPCAC_17842, partial [Pristionchus fissidentatus]
MCNTLCDLFFTGGVSTMFVITIERAMAVRNYGFYERSSSRLGVALTVLELGIVVGFFALVLFFYEFNLTYARCTIVTEKGRVVHSIQGVVLILMQIYSTILFTRLRTINRRKLKQENSLTLSERYQLTENVRTLDISHITLNLTVVFLFVLIHSLPLPWSINELSLSEEALGFQHLHSVIVPIVVY